MSRARRRLCISGKTGSRRCRLAAIVPLAATTLSVGDWRSAWAGRHIDSTISFHGRDMRTAANPVQGLLHTCQAIPENLVFANLGLTVHTTASQGVLLTALLVSRLDQPCVVRSLEKRDGARLFGPLESAAGGDGDRRLSRRVDRSADTWIFSSFARSTCVSWSPGTIRSRRSARFLCWRDGGQTGEGKRATARSFAVDGADATGMPGRVPAGHCHDRAQSPAGGGARPGQRAVAGSLRARDVSRSRGFETMRANVC